MQTIIDNFTLDRITKSAAIFDQDKLMWMNGVYIRELAFRELAERMVAIPGARPARHFDAG